MAMYCSFDDDDDMKYKAAGGPCIPKNPPINPLTLPAPICHGRVVPMRVFSLKKANQMPRKINVSPKIFLNALSLICERKQMAIVEINENAARIGHMLFQFTNFLNLMAIIAEVVIANRPDKAVASPYEGIRNGRNVMMKMPKPNPVVLCTKLAPIVRNKMYMMSSIFSEIQGKFS